MKTQALKILSFHSLQFEVWRRNLRSPYTLDRRIPWRLAVWRFSAFTVCSLKYEDAILVWSQFAVSVWRLAVCRSKFEDSNLRSPYTLDRRIPVWRLKVRRFSAFEFADRSLKTQILDRRIPWIAVYHEDSLFEDSQLSQFADRSMKTQS